MSRGAILIAGALAAVLVAFASGYGYHRDELYFITAGPHLDWGYPDQGPVTPLVARAMSEIAPDSLTVLRLPSALAAGATVLLTGLLARELGGGRRAQSLAAACAAVASIVLFTGHVLSTATFDLLAWTVITWLLIRAVRTADDRLLLIAGFVLGISLLNKPLPAFLAVGLLAGVVIAGPRHLLRNPYAWAAAAIALAVWSPWIVWQANHDWPQIDVSRAIAEGGSASSEPWWSIVPFQILLAGPLLAPIWIAGLVRLFRAPAVREVRFIAWAWVVLACVFMATGGKPYYLAGLLPVLIGAGAVPVDRWLARGHPRARKAALAFVVGVSGVIGATIALPVLPADRAGPVIAANEDVGETIGWPEFAQTLAEVHGDLPDTGRAVILTANYGEAGAVDRYGPELGLPPAYSGHNGYGHWGPPPEGSGPVIAVGLPLREMAVHLRGCVVAARIDNGVDVENQEQGMPVMVCRGPRTTWSEEWPALLHLD